MKNFYFLLFEGFEILFLLLFQLNLYQMRATYVVLIQSDFAKRLWRANPMACCSLFDTMFYFFFVCFSMIFFKD